MFNQFPGDISFQNEMIFYDEWWFLWDGFGGEGGNWIVLGNGYLHIGMFR